MGLEAVRGEVEALTEPAKESSVEVQNALPKSETKKLPKPETEQLLVPATELLQETGEVQDKTEKSSCGQNNEESEQFNHDGDNGELQGEPKSCLLAKTLMRRNS